MTSTQSTLHVLVNNLHRETPLDRWAPAYIFQKLYWKPCLLDYLISVGNPVYWITSSLLETLSIGLPHLYWKRCLLDYLISIGNPVYWITSSLLETLSIGLPHLYWKPCLLDYLISIGNPVYWITSVRTAHGVSMFPLCNITRSK